MFDSYNLLIENAGMLLAIAFVLFNLISWLAKRYRQKREQERYGHYAPAVRNGRLNYEDYRKRRKG